MPDPNIRIYRPEDEDRLVELWQLCDLIRPQNNPRFDIARKRAEQPDLLLVAELAGRLVGSVMVGYEGHRGWVNYLAVHPGEQRSGLGTALMAAAEEALRSRGCPKINLQVRTGNEAAVRFYRSLGFDIDDVVSLGKRLVVDAAK